MSSIKSTLTTFKDQHNFDQRKEGAESMRKKYPDKIPVIVEKHPRGKGPELKKKKFLVPQEHTVARFISELRKHLDTSLSAESAIFLFIGDVIPPSSALMSLVYESHRDEDGFLYIHYSGENTFGY
eukprot:TRINITY_DN2368_c0_g7_i1.p1 TRINITY_DN2368_c0_g7~~TRINITY_DN2368_c0_g7_i1.p1  ORF type:complete len:126 (-),score=32.71 TRINITY_DN2368_c0_g7_i1:111-488(-)